MPVSHRPFGISEAAVAAELDLRRTRHVRRLRAAQARLTKLRSENAARTEELFQLQAQIDEANAEKEGLMAQAAAAAEQRWDLHAALADQHQDDLARQRHTLSELKRRLKQYRTLRAQLLTGVLALIYPCLRERTPKEEARNV